MGERQQFAAWPFLIGRAAVQPIQVVAAPRPMCDARVYGILHQLTAHGSSFTSFGHAYWREWRRTDSFPAFRLAVIFHVIQATERFIGGETDRPLLDRNGRPIQLVEGFVCDEMGAALFLPGSVLLEAHRRVIETYRQFWHADIEQSYQVVPMPLLMTEPPITNEKGASQGVVVLHQLDPFVSDTPVFEGLRFTPAHARVEGNLEDGKPPTASLVSEAATDAAPVEGMPHAATETAAGPLLGERNANALHEVPRRQRWWLLRGRR